MSREDLEKEYNKGNVYTLHRELYVSSDREDCAVVSLAVEDCRLSQGENLPENYLEYNVRFRVPSTFLKEGITPDDLAKHGFEMFGIVSVPVELVANEVLVPQLGDKPSYIVASDKEPTQLEKMVGVVNVRDE